MEIHERRTTVGWAEEVKVIWRCPVSLPSNGWEPWLGNREEIEETPYQKPQAKTLPGLGENQNYRFKF